ASAASLQRATPNEVTSYRLPPADGVNPGATGCERFARRFAPARRQSARVRALARDSARSRGPAGANRKPLQTLFLVRTVAKRRARAPRIAGSAGRTRFALGDANRSRLSGSRPGTIAGVGTIKRCAGAGIN